MAANLSRRAILLVYTLVVAVPLLVVILGSFKTNEELFANPVGPPKSFVPENFIAVITGQDLGGAFLNSSIVAVVSVPTTLLLASLAAYGVSRMGGFWSWLIFGFLVLGMAIPAQTNMIALYVQFQQLGLVNSLFGLMLVNIVSTLPIAVFILTGFMKTLPKELFEASAIDGSGPLRTYWSIAMPLSAPSLAAAGIFLFVIHWNELLYPLLFVQSPKLRTLPLALLSYQGEYQTNYPLLFSAVILASAPVVVAYVFLQRYFVAGLTAGVSK